MPIYKLQGPDGKVYTIEGPAGATADQLAAVITGKPTGPSREQRIAADREAMRKEMDPTKDMSGFDRFVAGYGKAGADIVRGAGQLVGAVSRDDVAESRRLDSSLMNTTAGAVGNAAGTLAAFAPTAMIPGANTVTGGAAIGAASGLLQPSASTGETLGNIGVGGVVGGAVPLLITGAKTAKSFIEPLYQGGRDKIVGRAIADNAATDPAALARVLRTNKSQVPGVQRTVAEVADNPSLAALQRTASQTNPAVMNEAAARQTANNEARVAALQTVSGDERALAALKDARADAANVAYTTARKSDAMRRSLEIEQQVNKDAANYGFGSLGNLPQRTAEQSAEVAIRPTKALEKLAERPAFRSYIEEARRLAANKGVDIGNPLTSIDGLHYIKLAIDDALEGTATNALTRNAKSAVMDMKNVLIKEMDSISPVYGVAREAYSAASKPVTQMEIGQEIAGSAIHKLTGNIQPAAYARALTDKTAQDITGMSGATLANTLEPQALSTLNAVKDDLIRQNFAQTAGRGVGSDTVQKLAYSNMLNQAGVPSAVRNFGPSGILGNVAQRAGQVVYKDANEKLSDQLARALLDPNQAADLVTGSMVTPRMNALVNGLRRAGTAGGAAAPALLQANQN
jgi:hypothetical protein